MATKTISPRQVSFVRDLVTDRKVVNGITDVDAFMLVLSEQRLTSKGAHALIDTLLAQPKDAPKVDPAAPAPAPASDIRTNRYSGKCGYCGIKVAEGEGRIEKHGRWVTYHLDGECPKDLQTQLNELLDGQEDGYFAVPFIGQAGQTDLTFFGIRTRNNSTHDRYVVHVIGGHAETEDVTIEWTERALASLATVDRRAASEAYGVKMGYCGLCGRHLTNETSRALGIGPDCAAR